MRVVFADREMNEPDRIKLSKGIDSCLSENSIDKNLNFTISIDNENTYIKSIKITSKDKELESKITQVLFPYLDKI